MKMRSERSRRFLIHHLIPVFLFLFISVLIFRNLIGSEGEIINADLIKPPDLERFFQFFNPMWSERENINVISRLPQLLIYLPFFGIGFLFGLDTAGVLILMFIFIEFLAGTSMFYVSRYLLKKTYRNKDLFITVAAFSAGLAYMWNTFLIQRTFHPILRLAYAIAPIIIITLIIGLENRKPKYIILTGFLWCLVCANTHWAVYGAILLFSFIVFNFLLEFAHSLHRGKLLAFKETFVPHLTYMIILVGFFAVFSAYWLVPGFLMGGTSRYGYVLAIERLQNFYSESSMIDIMSAYGQHHLAPSMFRTDSPILGNPAMRELMIVLNFGLFIVGMLALVLKPKNRYVAFFSIFALVSLFLATCVNVFPSFGIWLILDAPLHEWYGWAFRSSKISGLLVMSLCFLLGFTLMEILTRIRNSEIGNVNLKKGITLFIIFLLFLSILLPNWPLATGDINGLLTPVEMPDEFAQVNQWLEAQAGDFNVLWVPRYSGEDVEWNEGHRMYQDIAGFSSSRPTYNYYDSYQRAHRNCFHFFTSVVDLYYYSMPNTNATNNLGKMLAPLGIRYIIYHDDNAIRRDRGYVLLDYLYNQ
jgi:hypothetical protein